MAKKTESKTTKSKSDSPKEPKEKKEKKLTKRVSRKTTKTNALDHFLVPEHVKLNDKEKEDLFKLYHIKIKELPKIYIDDPAIRHLGVKANDVIKITRKSPTAGEAIFYRGVIDE